MLEQQEKIVTVSQITGSKVFNKNGEELGKIENLMVDLATNRIRFAVLSVGGFFGLVAKSFVFAWDTLSLNKDGKGFVLNLDITREWLERVPAYDASASSMEMDITAAGDYYVDSSIHLG